MRKSMKLLVAIMILCTAVSVYAKDKKDQKEKVDPVRVFNEASAAYNRSDFAKADKLLDKAVKNGLKDPQLSDVKEMKSIIRDCSPTKNGPATKVWNIFVNALEKGDYKTAYHQMTKAEQKRVSFEKFKTEAARARAGKTHEELLVSPGREERINKKTIILHFCRDNKRRKSLKLELEEKKWRFTN